MPEPAVTLGARRIGAFDMAIGNLFGSKLFDSRGHRKSSPLISRSLLDYWPTNFVTSLMSSATRSQSSAIADSSISRNPSYSAMFRF